MANKETTAPETTNAAPAADAAPAAPSKMELCKGLFKDLKEDKIELPEGKTKRAFFIKEAQEKFGLTNSGAATYWQNLVSQDRGGKLYPHTASKKKAGEQGPAEGTVPADEKPADEAPAEKAEGDAKSEDDLSHLES